MSEDQRGRGRDRPLMHRQVGPDTYQPTTNHEGRLYTLDEIRVTAHRGAVVELESCHLRVVRSDKQLLGLRPRVLVSLGAAADPQLVDEVVYRVRIGQMAERP